MMFITVFTLQMKKLFSDLVANKKVILMQGRTFLKMFQYHIIGHVLWKFRSELFHFSPENTIEI